MEKIDKNSILLRLPLVLRKFVLEIWKNGQVGISAGNMQITKVISTKCEQNEAKYGNRLTLSIPIAGQFVNWDVIFSSDDLTFAPDFEFDDDSFLADPDQDLIENYIPSLANWDPDNSKSLLNVIKELMMLYRKHQMEVLEDDRYCRIHFEYSSLISNSIGAENVEVLTDPSGIVHFLIAIPIDFSALPPYIQEEKINKVLNPSHDSTMLMVTFHRLDGKNIVPKLILSPLAEQIFGKNKNLPPFTAESCLMDYVPEIQKILADKVEEIAKNFQMKTEYITQLLMLQYNGSIVEYDAMTFSKATLLFEHRNFYWLLNVSLGQKFPSERPVWSLRSVYHMTFGQPLDHKVPYTETLTDYPYSPRWSVEEMITRAFTFMLQEIPSFQSSSIQKSCI